MTHDMGRILSEIQLASVNCSTKCHWNEIRMKWLCHASHRNYLRYVWSFPRMVSVHNWHPDSRCYGHRTQLTHLKKPMKNVEDLISFAQMKMTSVFVCIWMINKYTWVMQGPTLPSPHQSYRTYTHILRFLFFFVCVCACVAHYIRIRFSSIRHK